MIPKYFTPQDATGIQRFTQGGTGAGWYQLNRVGIAVAALPGITIPFGATGLLIQAVANLQYCQSPTAAASPGTAYMTLAAGDYMFLPGQEALNQFCVLLTTGGEFTIQFLFGDIGPAPWINQHSTGGVIPPPPPGSGAQWRINTLYVMEQDGSGNGGHDAGPLAGTRNRADLPYLTIAAAEADAVAGDTIVILPGDYTTATLGKDRVLYHRLGASITCASGPLFLADGITFGVIGWGSLVCTDTAAYALEATNAGTMLVEGSIIAAGGGAYCHDGSSQTINGSISAGTLEGLYCEEGEQVVSGSVHSNYTVGVYADNVGSIQRLVGRASSGTTSGAATEGGEQYITGDVIGIMASAAYCGDAIQVIVGNVYMNGTGTAAEVAVSTGLQTIRGNVFNATSGMGAVCTDGTQLIYGSVSAIDNTAAECVAVTSKQTIHGNIFSATGRGAACADGDQLIYGDVNTVDDYAAYCAGGVQVIFGDAQAEANWAMVCAGGNQTVWGDATALGTGGWVACDCLGGGTQVLHGNATRSGGGGFGASSAGTQEIYGNVFNDGGIGYKTYAGGVVRVRGNIASADNYGIYCSDGVTVVDGMCTGGPDKAGVSLDGGATLTLGGGASATIGINPTAAIELQSGSSTLFLLGAARLFSVDGEFSIIESGAAATSIRSYGAYANVAEEGTLTITGVLNVLP